MDLIQFRLHYPIIAAMASVVVRSMLVLASVTDFDQTDVLADNPTLV